MELKKYCNRKANKEDLAPKDQAKVQSVHKQGVESSQKLEKD
jgi:hypothetical protein